MRMRRKAYAVKKEGMRGWKGWIISWLGIGFQAEFCGFFDLIIVKTGLFWLICVIKSGLKSRFCVVFLERRAWRNVEPLQEKCNFFCGAGG